MTTSSDIQIHSVLYKNERHVYLENNYKNAEQLKVYYTFLKNIKNPKAFSTFYF